VDDDFFGPPDKFDPFKTKCNFRSLKNYFIDKYVYFKILSLKYKIFLISFNIVFKVHGLFISLSTFNWRHSPKSLSSAETDLVESTINYCPAALGGQQKS
jgi:hypothetical protein